MTSATTMMLTPQIISLGLCMHPSAYRVSLWVCLLPNSAYLKWSSLPSSMKTCSFSSLSPSHPNLKPEASPNSFLCSNLLCSVILLINFTIFLILFKYSILHFPTTSVLAFVSSCLDYFRNTLIHLSPSHSPLIHSSFCFQSDYF